MKMFTIKSGAHVYVYKNPVNMSCGFPKLTDLAEKTDGDISKGDLYLFVNKKRNYVKILFHAKDGMCIFSKKIPAGRFQDVSKDTLSLKDLTHLVDYIVRHGKKERKLKLAA